MRPTDCADRSWSAASSVRDTVVPLLMARKMMRSCSRRSLACGDISTVSNRRGRQMSSSVSATSRMGWPGWSGTNSVTTS